MKKYQHLIDKHRQLEIEILEIELELFKAKIAENRMKREIKIKRCK